MVGPRPAGVGRCIWASAAGHRSLFPSSPPDRRQRPGSQRPEPRAKGAGWPPSRSPPDAWRRGGRWGRRLGQGRLRRRACQSDRVAGCVV